MQQSQRVVLASPQIITESWRDAMLSTTVLSPILEACETQMTELTIGWLRRAARYLRRSRYRRCAGACFHCANQSGENHSRGNGNAYCAFDYGFNNSGLTYDPTGELDPGLNRQGDLTIEQLEEAIQASRAWRDSRRAIVIVWDESDCESAVCASWPHVGHRQGQIDVACCVITPGRRTPPWTRVSSIQQRLGFGCGLNSI